VSEAKYLSDRVDIGFSLERSATRPTQQLVRSFVWPRGTVNVRHRVAQGGLIPQIIESWYPKNDDSYGVILEDDIEVSPMFYAWVKWAILKYRYDKEEKKRTRGLFGVSLYQQNHSEMQRLGPKRLPFDARKVIDDIPNVARTSPYLSQVPCSWGAVYFPEMWREFHDYLPLRQSETSITIKQHIIPDIRTNGWHTSWKRFINELIYLRGYSMLYPNYDDWLAFSTNHFEPGEHLVLDSPEKIAFREEQLLYFRVPLFPEESIMKRGMPGGLMPNWEQLPKLDFWGKVQTESHLRAVGRQSHQQVFPQMKPPTMEDDNDPWQSDFRAASLLCAPDSNSTWCEEA